MHLATGAGRRTGVVLGVGLGLLAVYVLPLYFPPPPRWIVPAAAETPVLERLFPHVPGWWVVGRLLALVAGAWIVSGAVRRERDAVAVPPPASVPAESPAALRLAFVAAALHLACLPFVRQLPYFAKSLYVLWVFVPAAILVAGRLLRGRAWPALGGGRKLMLWCAGGLVGCWAAVRLWFSWHSPIAADCVDMFRTLGGLVRLAKTGADFLVESMGVTEGVGDIEVVGVNAVQLFFEGLPLLRLFGHQPCMWWMQVFNAVWLSLAALVVFALARLMVGGLAALVAGAAFLFSPFVLMIQILPVPAVCMPLAALIVFLPVRFHQTGSALTLTLLGGVAGLTAMIPSQTPMTALALGIAALAIRRRADIPRIAMVTAGCSFLAMCVPNVPRWEVLRAAYEWYVTKDWPMVIGEATLQGQISPTVASWTTVDPPGTLLLVVGTLLSPFAIPRNSLRNFGDVLYEPVSAALAAVGLVLCLRRARRDRAALYVLAFLAAALAPGFVSSYDRPSLTRVYGATITLALLAAVGLRAVMLAAGGAGRRTVEIATSVVVAASGLVIFDVVNPRILSSSTWGILMRTVDEETLPRVAMLTSYGSALNPPDAKYETRFWEADWLRTYHPYIEELARCAPRRPVAIVALESPDELARHDILFWNPALEQTIAVTQRYVCRQWPGATLFTIHDRNRLSQVYAARVGGPPWEPRAPRGQWSSYGCGTPREVPPLWRMLGVTAASAGDS